MTLVYILSEYEEHGAEKVVATLDSNKLIEMFNSNWKDVVPAFSKEVKRSISLILEKKYPDILNEEGWDCNNGWGGIQLHIIELL